MAQNRDRQAFYDWRNFFTTLLTDLNGGRELIAEYDDAGMAQRWTDLNQTEPTFFTDQGVTKAQMNDAIDNLRNIFTAIDTGVLSTTANQDAKWRRVRN